MGTQIVATSLISGMDLGGSLLCGGLWLDRTRPAKAALRER
jgi:hypothetical protein